MIAACRAEQDIGCLVVTTVFVPRKAADFERGRIGITSERESHEG